MIRSLALAAALLCAVSARTAAACAVCGAGDPTLNAAGTERPYAGRLRLSADLRAGGARVGERGAGLLMLREQRLDLSVAYAPTAPLLLTIDLPGLHRRVTSGAGDRADAWTPGDVDLRVRGFILRAARGAFTHEVALVGGLKLPTAPLAAGPSGAPLPPALQPGGSSITPLAGAAYDARRGPWFFYASAAFFLPFAIRTGAHACDVLRASASVQYQPRPAFAARLGLDARIESSAANDARADPDAGGVLGYVSPEVLVSPATDLVLVFGARFPAAQALRGAHREDTIVSIGVAYDLR